MAKRNTTKRALLLSCLSVLLCLSMLIGSTFAWFTDSATTGVNTITSGNLDMKVSYKNADVTSWTEVSESAKLFNDVALWEPGYTEVTYLKVENNGNLALKYQLTVNVINEVVGTSVLGNEIKLSEVLKYDLIPLSADTAYVDRDAALAAVTDAKALATETVSGAIAANATENYYALVVYMPETTGNEANHNGANVPSIQLGVNVAATQNTAESDSFDDQYDVNAFVPQTAYGNKAVSGDTVLKSKNVTVTIPGTATLTSEGAAELQAGDVLVFSVEPTALNTNIVINEGENAETYEISLVDDNGSKVTSTEDITVAINIGTGRTGAVAVYHNNERINGVSYDITTGIVTFTTKDFSPFTVVEKRVLVGGNGTTTAGGTDDEKDIRATLALGGVVDFGGAVLESTSTDGNWGGNLREYTFKDGTTVKNLTIKGAESATRWWKANGNVTFENCTFETDGIYGIHIGEGDGTVTFKNCTINGWSTFGSTLTKLVFEGCTFIQGNSSYNAVATRCDTVFKDCVFKGNTGIIAGKPDTRFEWTITNCTFDGVAITAENIKNFPYTSYAGIDSDVWTKNNLVVNGTVVQ